MLSAVLKRRLSVQRLGAAEALAAPADLGIVALGYEARARFIAQRLSGLPAHAIAIEFASAGRLLDYDSNRSALEALGWSLMSLTDEDFLSRVSQRVRTAVSHRRKPAHIVIDISSFSRNRIAWLLEAIWRCLGRYGGVVDLLYSPAEYSAPVGGTCVIETLEPVTPAFSGWSGVPECATSLVLGLGYEAGVARGVHEAIEPSAMWMFLPVDGDERYLSELRSANAELLEGVNRVRVVEYRARDPYDAFLKMAALARGAQGRERMILVPMGPKVLAAVSMCVGLQCPWVSVIRASTHAGSPPQDRIACGDVVGVRLVIDGSPFSGAADAPEDAM